MAAVGRDGGLGQRSGGDVERRDLDLDAAELDALVVLQLAVAVRKVPVVSAEIASVSAMPSALPTLLGSRVPRVDQLHRTGLIAQDDELHLLLIADGLDPAATPRPGRLAGLQLLDENAFTHERPVYVAGCGLPTRCRLGAVMSFDRWCRAFGCGMW